MIVFGPILLARRSVDSVDIRVPAIRDLDDWFFVLRQNRARIPFPELVWVTVLGNSKTDARYRQWVNWRDVSVAAHMVPNRGECLGISFLYRNFDFFIPTLEWKYRSVLSHRFDEDLEMLRTRFYCRYYDRYPVSYHPCTAYELDKERSILLQWLRGRPEDDFESEEDEELGGTPSVEDKEDPPPPIPFSESSSEPYSVSSTPPSEAMVADSVVTSPSGGSRSGSDVHMHSGTDDDRQSVNTAGFIVPDDGNAEHDDEAYPGSDKDDEDDGEDVGDDESGNDNEPAPVGNAVSPFLFSCLTSHLLSSLSVYTAPSVTSSVPVL